MGDRRSNVTSSIGEGPHFHVLIEDIMVGMRDSVKLAGDLYIPAIDGKVDPHKRWPCVLVRTPYNKSVVNPDFRNPGIYWTQNGYCCFIQDVRGRFKSQGVFYKYTGEAEDGYDTVEWLGKQPWCNGNIVSDGPSYLAHVQVSMALLRPPHLKAMFINKGGFYNAYTSGVRSGGCFECRQWVWGIKNASRKTQQLRSAIIEIESQQTEWFKRYPWKQNDSPLSNNVEYESYLYDQVNNETYSKYWKQIGLNCEEYIDQFSDIPCLLLSGWFDIYCKSTIQFYVALSQSKQSPMRLIMGPWQHVGTEGHVAGEVDFGVNALITGNLAPNVFSLSRRWFDRFTEPATSNNKHSSTSEQKLQQAISQAEKQQQMQQQQFNSNQQHSSIPSHNREPTITSLHNLTNIPSQHIASHSTLQQQQQQYPSNTQVRGPYTSLSILGSQYQVPTVDQNSGPSLYVLPNTLPKDRTDMLQDQLPPPVRYFRMGGGDGHKTTQNCIFHGGVWMQSYHWPPLGTQSTYYFLGQRVLSRNKYDTKQNNSSNNQNDIDSTSDKLNDISLTDKVKQDNNDNTTQTNVGLNDDIDSWRPCSVDSSVKNDQSQCTTFVYDPRDPLPSIGGHVFQHKNILLGGSYNQVERADMFMCKPPYLPLSSRQDVIVFRSDVLTDRLDITGHPYVILYISSDCVDTDIYVKLIDEYPPCNDYPLGFAMLVTHGIQRVKFRKNNGLSQPEYMTPGQCYAIRVDMYPTSNLFNKGHKIRLDISSSCFPHWDINRNTGINNDTQDYKIARNTIYHAQIYPSRLCLPVQTKSQNTHMSHMEEAIHM